MSTKQPAASRFDIEGRRALVTGASLGMGQAIAMELARNGSDVVVHHASSVDQALGEPDAAAEIVAAIEALGRRAWRLDVDLAAPGAGRAVAEQAVGLAERVDILVICASIQYNAPFLETTDEQFERQVAINYKAPHDLLQAALPSMARRGWGRVLAVGSINQYAPRAHLTTYAALKSAQFNLVRNLAAQYAPHGVTVNNIAPGLMRTPRNRWRREDIAGWEETAAACCPMHRAGEPDDVAGAALLLCSDAGSYITGVDLVVAGGMQLAWQDPA